MDWHPRELNFGTRLEKLHLHYMEYLETLDDSQFSSVLLDWIEQNPPYGSEYWLDNWNSYALSIRTAVWMTEYVARGPRLTKPVRRAIEQSLIAQLRFLERNLEYDIGGNHLLKNIRALLLAGRFFAGRSARGWFALAERLLDKELREQILSDGFHFELSPAYHTQAFADLLECYQLVEDPDLRSRLEQTLVKMAQVIADMTHPDGRPSLFNDGGLHMTYSPAQVMSAFTALTGVQVSPRNHFSLEAAGYFGMREGGDLLIVDCGRVGPDHLPAHAHGDILSFEWSLNGQRVVVDAGVFEYNPGKWRSLARSTASHNTVTVGDEDQCEFWKAFRVGRRANVALHRYSTVAGLELDGSHDGFRRLSGAPVHRRQFRATSGQVDVSDSVSGGAGQAVAARLLLHPAMRVRSAANHVEISHKKVTVYLTTPHKVAIADAWWCPDFNVRMPTKQLTIHYGHAPCAGAFRLSRQD